MATRNQRHPRISGTWPCWVFLAILFTPLAVVIFDRDEDFPVPESVGEVLLLPNEFKYYFAVEFKLRNKLAALHGRIIGQVDGHDRSSHMVKVGKEGWLYYFMQKRNVAAFGFGNDASVQLQLRSIQHKQNFCAERNVIYLPLIIPTKTSVYAEYLPDRIARQLGTRHNSVTPLHRYLQTKGTNIRSVDLLLPFRMAKTNAPVYFRTDAHWNEYGAYVGAEEILRELRKSIPGPTQPTIRPQDHYHDLRAGERGQNIGSPIRTFR